MSDTETRGDAFGHPLNPTGRPDPQSVLAASLSVWCVLLALWLAWTPFWFLLSIDAEPILPPTNALDVAGNLLLFAPLAIVLALRASEQPVRRVVLAAALVSLSIEVGQLFSPVRVASPLDFLLNTAGAGLMAALVLRLRRNLPDGSILGAGLGVVYAGLLSLGVYSGIVFAGGMRLEGWSPTFEIGVGDEVGADREYVGSVEDAFICAGAAANRLCAGAGADYPTRIRLVAAAERDQEFEIGARVVSGSDTQTGPTRIITFSRGGYLRNATLGQDSTAVIIRVRTPLLGTNGRDYELLIPDAISQNTPAVIRTRFRKGTAHTVIETEHGSRTVDHVFDAFSGGIVLRGPGRVSPGQAISRRLFMVLLLIPPLCLVGKYTTGRKQRGPPEP